VASIRERRSAGGETTFQVLYRVDGKQRSTTFRAAPRPHRPENFAADFKALVDILGPEKALATLAGQSSGGLTVDELAERFFAWKEGDVTPRTMADYRRDYANWIRPVLGDRVAESVDEMDVQQLVDSMRAKLEPKSVADRHMLLHSIYKFGSARTRRLVTHNPCTETQLPKRVAKPAKGVTLPEYHALAAAARAVDPDAADLVEFIAGTGWRFSEAIALTAGHVEDTERGTYATMSAVFRRDCQNRSVHTVDVAKSRAGLRRTRLPRRVAELVLRRVVGKAPEDLVFTNSAGRRWHQQNFLARLWPRIEAEAQLGRHVTPHALRHTHVAMLDRAGVPLAEMQRRMGHESIQTTIDVYGGMIDDIDDAALERLDAMLDPTPADGEVVAGGVVLRRELL
jgi:integrase